MSVIKLLLAGSIGALAFFFGQLMYFWLKKKIFYNDLNVSKIKKSK